MISWFATLLSIAGILLNARKHMWCWPIWIVSNVVWVYYFTILNPLVSAVVLNVVFAGANVYGWYFWTKTPNLILKRPDNYVQDF